MTDDRKSAPKADALPGCATPRAADALRFPADRAQAESADRGNEWQNTAGTGEPSPGIVPERQTIYIAWSDDGHHIRKWSREPFDGGEAVEAVSVGADIAQAVAPIWRNGVTNTAAIIDIARRRFNSLIKLTPKQRSGVEHFDAFLDKAVQDWFDATRAASPTIYEEAEQVFKDHIERTDHSDQAGEGER